VPWKEPKEPPMKKPPRRLFRNRPPAPPPELDRLRDARRVIDPGRVYGLALPGGTLYAVPGSALIETAEALLSLGDAMQSGDGRGARAAFDRVRADTGRDGGAVILCTKVGHAPCAPPAGYLTADCGQCGSAVWISPESHTLIGSCGAVPVCNVCVSTPDGP
jgi:hypothetical protein